MLKYFILSFLFFVTASPALAQKVIYPEELLNILNKQGSYESGVVTPEVQNLRKESLVEAAYTLGVQAGAVYQHKRIITILNNRDYELELIFPFRSFLIEGQVLPPVILEAFQSRKVKDSQLVETDVSYRIIKPARFISNPPSWRDYFKANFGITKISDALYPRSEEEKEVWKNNVLKGWERGKQQAFSIFLLNLKKISSDVTGMILFQQLAGQGVVSLPHIAEGRLALRVGNDALDLNSRSFKITMHSKFNKEEKWKPFQTSP